MSGYGVMTDYDYSAAHKRQRLTVWSGPFASVFEGEAFSLPSGGFMLSLYVGGKARVQCPSPRTEDNYHEVDAAISKAVDEWYAANGYRTMAQTSALLESANEIAEALERGDEYAPGQAVEVRCSKGAQWQGAAYISHEGENRHTVSVEGATGYNIADINIRKARA